MFWCAAQTTFPPTPRPSYRHTSGQKHLFPHLFDDWWLTQLSVPPAVPLLGESFLTQGLSWGQLVLQGIKDCPFAPVGNMCCRPILAPELWGN